MVIYYCVINYIKLQNLKHLLPCDLCWSEIRKWFSLRATIKGPAWATWLLQSSEIHFQEYSGDLGETCPVQYVSFPVEHSRRVYRKGVIQNTWANTNSAVCHSQTWTLQSITSIGGRDHTGCAQQEAEITGLAPNLFFTITAERCNIHNQQSLHLVIILSWLIDN